MTYELEESYHINERNEAILWAIALLEQDFVILDTETTGLDDDAEMCQIGIVSKTGKVLLDCLVKPTISIPPGVSKLHGITDEDVRHSPTFVDILPIVDMVIGPRLVAIYNESFDTRILNQSAKAHKISGSVKPSGVCVMDEFARFYGEWSEWHGTYRWQKLTEAARYFGIDTTGAHGAAADCLMTLRVIEAMAGQTIEVTQ